MKAAEWISLGSFVAAAVSAFVAFLQARRAKASQDAAAHYQARAEQNAERATQAAEEAATAQRQTATEAGRVAKAIEEQNRVAEQRAEQAEGVPWQIRHREGDLCDLWNITETTKFGVRIEGGGVLQPKTVDRIDGRSSAEFFATRHMGASNDVLVTWYRRADLSDEPRRWRGNKPPRL
ncbi:hypothetical protein U8D42_12750 [Mycobacterium europaeum]|uniref:hypothetical protein n=1 Tax=Mycobacterium europaeum TaxID=761804 RepID=UPI002AE0402B|nr:hypothetical protein [Mycobacterium europaeum]MEA1160665.1 hypothetical protein [Mycobacterium europaeum]